MKMKLTTTALLGGSVLAAGNVVHAETTTIKPTDKQVVVETQVVDKTVVEYDFFADIAKEKEAAVAEKEETAAETVSVAVEYVAPAPVAEKPAVETPAPAPVIETSAPAVEAPVPVVEKPVEVVAPVAEKPAPAVETPAPAPVVETPAPAPVIETPAPVVEIPAPVAENPVEEKVDAAKAELLAVTDYKPEEVPAGVPEGLTLEPAPVETPAPAPVAPSFATYAPSYNYDVFSYEVGQCTWGVKVVAPWVGNYWGNGGQWGASARAAGFRTGSEPVPGAVISWDDGGYGHVALVTDVDPTTGNIQVLESNYGGNMTIGNYRGWFNPLAVGGRGGGVVTYIYPN